MGTWAAGSSVGSSNMLPHVLDFHSLTCHDTWTGTLYSQCGANTLHPTVSSCVFPQLSVLFFKMYISCFLPRPSNFQLLLQPHPQLTTLPSLSLDNTHGEQAMASLAPGPSSWLCRLFTLPSFCHVCFSEAEASLGP